MYINVCAYTVAWIRDVNPSLQKVVHFLRAVIFNPHCLSPFFPYFALFPKNFSPSKIYKKKIVSTETNGNTCTETRRLSHCTTDAATAILFLQAPGKVLQSLLPSSHGRVRLHEVGAAAPVHPGGGKHQEGRQNTVPYIRPKRPS